MNKRQYITSIVLVVAILLCTISFAPAKTDLFSEGEKAYVQEDYPQAVKLFKQAGWLGNVDAQVVLGGMYFFGHKVPQDYDKARSWYTKAAKQNNGAAQSNLGIIYANGLGIEKDYVQAYKWLNLAVAHGNPIALENLEKIVSKMTPEQLSEAQELAKNWKAAKEVKQPSVVNEEPNNDVQTWGRIVTIPFRIALREGRSTKTKYLRTLIPGEKVRLSFLRDGWYAVFKENESANDESKAIGYLYAKLVDPKKK